MKTVVTLTASDPYGTKPEMVLHTEDGIDPTFYHTSQRKRASLLELPRPNLVFPNFLTCKSSPLR